MNATKKNILIVGDENRKDILSMFDLLKKDTELFTVKHDFEQKNVNNIKGFQIIFWNNYSDVFELLKVNKIDAILFLAYGDYLEICLHLAGQQMNIPVLMLSHGLLFPETYDYRKTLTKRNFTFYLKKTPFLYLYGFLKNKLLVRTYRKLNKKSKPVLFKYYKIRFRNDMYTTFDKASSFLPNFTRFICFNSRCIQWYRRKHGIHEQNNLFKIIGIPNFDRFKIRHNEGVNKKNIVLIDHPYYEENAFGWTKRYKTKFINDIITNLQGYSFTVKPHPKNDVSFWNNFNQFKVVNDNEWVETLKTHSIFLSFSSTLLIPVACLKNNLVFTLENHPLPPEGQDLSYMFYSSGVAERIESIQDLADKLQKFDELIKKQNSLKSKFEKKFMYKNDGQATKRLTQTILNEIS